MLTVSKGKKLLLDTEVMKQSLYLFCLTFITGGHCHSEVVAQTCKTWLWMGELSIAFESARDITDTTGQALEPGA